MKTSTWLLVVIALVLGVWLGRQTASTEPVSSDVVSAEVEVIQTPDDLSENVPIGEAGQLACRVEVMDEQTGRPLPGARIRIADNEWVTNASGLAEIDVPRPFTMEIRHSRRLTRVIEARLGETQVFVSMNSSAIEVSVEDLFAGRSLEGVTLQVGAATFVTDSQGRVLLPETVAGSREVIIEQPGFATVREPFELVPGAVGMVIALQANVISGTVTDLEGHPVAAAQIRVGERESQSDEMGVFEIPYISMGMNDLKVVAANFESLSQKLNVTSNEFPLEIILKKKQ